MVRQDILDFCASCGIMTDPGQHAAALASLPDDIARVCNVVKVETVPYLVGRPWDSWELVAKSDDEMTEDELRLLDRVAEISLHPDENFDEMRRLYEKTPGLRPPADQV